MKEEYKKLILKDYHKFLKYHSHSSNKLLLSLIIIKPQMKVSYRKAIINLIKTNMISPLN